MRALEKKPTARFADAGQFIIALTRAGTALASDGPVDTSVLDGRRSAPKRALAWADTEPLSAPSDYEPPVAASSP